MCFAALENANVNVMITVKMLHAGAALASSSRPKLA